MDFNDFQKLYDEMVSLFAKDKELTHIDVSFHIKPVLTEKKIAKINVKTFKDVYKINK